MIVVEGERKNAGEETEAQRFKKSDLVEDLHKKVNCQLQPKIKGQKIENSICQCNMDQQVVKIVVFTKYNIGNKILLH